MRTTTWIAAFLLISLMSFSQEEHIEKASLNCLYEAYLETKVDIKKELEDYEAFLIKNEFLDDASGKSYKKFFQKTYEIGAVPATRPDQLFWRIVKSKFVQDNSKTCILEKLVADGHFVSIATLNDSKMYKVLMELSSKPEDPLEIFKHFAEVVLTNLNEKELEKPYYKTMLLMTIAVSSNMEGHTQFTPFPSPESYDNSNKN